LSQERIELIGWAVGSVYSAAITALITWTMISFPGYVYNGSLDRYYSWILGLYARLNFWVDVFWASINIMATLVTIYAICKIFATAKAVSSSDQSVNVNLKMMLMHACLLVV
jgi:hypothetical protein